MQEKKILVIKFGGLGDIILSLNAIFSIIKHHKNKKFTLLTEEPYKVFFGESGWFQEIVTIKRSSFYIFDKYQIKKKLSVNSFSNVYDLQTSKRSSSYLKIFYDLQIKTCGIGKYSSYCHSNRSRNQMHTITRQNDQLEIAGIKRFLAPDLRWLFRSEKTKIPKSRYALVVPGGSIKRMNKRIPLKIYIKLINYLTKQKILPIILGAEDDKLICKEIENHFPNVKNLCSKTDIFQIAKLAKGALISFGNDTGPMHVISKGERPTFVFFTRNSDPKLCSPVGKGVKLFHYDEKHPEDILPWISREINKVINLPFANL